MWGTKTLTELTRGPRICYRATGRDGSTSFWLGIQTKIWMITEGIPEEAEAESEAKP